MAAAIRRVLVAEHYTVDAAEDGEQAVAFLDAHRYDVVILDRLAHASMVDGARLSGAQVKVFHHNDVAHLDSVLRRNRDAGTKLVATDADFGARQTLYAASQDLPGNTYVGPRFAMRGPTVARFIPDTSAP